MKNVIIKTLFLLVLVCISKGSFILADDASMLCLKTAEAITSSLKSDGKHYSCACSAFAQELTEKEKLSCHDCEGSYPLGSERQIFDSLERCKDNKSNVCERVSGANSPYSTGNWKALVWCTKT